VVGAEKPHVQGQDRSGYEFRNQISIVLANVEGMIDGLVSATPQRLEAVADALREARRLLEQASGQSS
jgi:hypothetical protein